MKSIGWDSSGNVEKDFHTSLKDLRERMDRPGYKIWVDLEKPRLDELETLLLAFHLHPLAIEDLLSPAEYPKVDIYETYLMMVLHTFGVTSRKTVSKTLEIDAILGRNFLITSRGGSIPAAQKIWDSFLERKSEQHKRGCDFALALIVDEIVSSYFAWADDCDTKLNKLQSDLTGAKHSGVNLHGLTSVRRLNAKMRSILSPQREAIRALSQQGNPFITNDVRRYFQDAHDHAFQLYSLVETQREILANTMESYLIAVFNRNNEISNRINSSMHRLTVVATIFMPLTFITGIYGMNFKNMPELEWKFGYLVVLALMFVIFWGMLKYFKKKELS